MRTFDELEKNAFERKSTTQRYVLQSIRMVIINTMPIKTGAKQLVEQ